MQDELCLKDTFVKATFIFVTNFLHIIENLMRKNFIIPSCPKHPKMIETKNDMSFCFHTSFWSLKKVS